MIKLTKQCNGMFLEKCFGNIHRRMAMRFDRHMYYRSLAIDRNKYPKREYLVIVGVHV